MLDVQQLDRYARHIVLPGVGATGQIALLSARVLVIGAGGLGSPVLQYLAAAGVGTLGIVDDDVVSVSNLQRQVLFTTADIGRLKAETAAVRIAALDPEIDVQVLTERIDEANVERVLTGFDIVVDGSDNFATRYAINDACARLGIPLVYGAISQFEGQVSVLNAEIAGARGPCYRCLFPEPPAAGVVPSCSEAGVFGALPGAIGSLMAGEVIKWLTGVGAPLVGTLLHVDMAEARTHRFELRRNPGCPACGKNP